MFFNRPRTGLFGFRWIAVYCTRFKQVNLSSLHVALCTHQADILQADLTLSSGHQLPKHSVVLCHHRVAALQEENFSRAQEFLPERWLPGQQLQNHKSSLVLPFGAGKRMCPGKRLAEQELNIIAAKLFQNFNIEMCDPLELEFNYLLTPAGPIRLKLTERE